MTSLISEYNAIIGQPTQVCATQDQLDQIGLYLDEMERIEAYMDSDKCTRDEYADCESERLYLCDRLDALMEYV
jgi:hypothetical protein